MYVYNAQEDVSMNTTASFSVKFGGNTATVSIQGAAAINFHRINESYFLSRRIPDTVITNVILPLTRKMYWNGEISISCPQTGFSAVILFKDDNNVRATIKNSNGEELMTFEGKCGGTINRTKPDKGLLVDVPNVKKPRIHFQPVSELDPFSSVLVWGDCNKYIVENDLDRAEEAKKKVEQEQRVRNKAREQSGEHYNPRFFCKNENDVWVFKEPAGGRRSRAPSEYDGEGDDLLNLGKARKPPQQATQSPAIGRKSEQPTAAEKGKAPEAALLPSGHRRSMTPGATVSTPVLTSSNPPPSPAPGKPELTRPVSSFLPMSPLAGSSPTSSDVDMSSNLLSGWVKLRNSMKIWKNRWFVLRPGRLIYYKEEKKAKKDRCVGIFQLADCIVEERPTSMEGFSFKITNTLSYPIYEKKGLKGESIKMASVPMGWTQAILLVGSEGERRMWMNAVQEQINWATHTRRLKNDKSSPNVHASGSAAPTPLPVRDAGSGSEQSHSPEAKTFTAPDEASDRPTEKPREKADERSLEFSEEDDESMTVPSAGGRSSIEKLLVKQEETQRQLLQAVVNQIKQQQNRMQSELDEKLLQMEKKITGMLARSKESSGSSVQLYIIIALSFLVLILWWWR
jgi:hypothetical protein